MKELFEAAVIAVETAAVLLVVIGLTLAFGQFLYRTLKGSGPSPYRLVRRDLGRTLLLALELLIAADIIDTVAGEPTLQSLGLLGLLVVIRTFLGFTLETELTGRWPWQGDKGASAGK